ncbi:sacsin N-terminal ATP-binding-like domain-containing protein [Belliella marina]|uniref:Sacsin N-terminal ATP-binding-like domain-containing protein n=1 Tax=Belliella marina TaxID=1644146 RepID=A0ABW4VS19_9BACT
MSLKEDIENLFKKNTGYAEPEHAINQAESLKSLSVDLYTDSKRFVYELLQNADDSVISGVSVKVGIRLFDDFLVVAHTGKPFDKRDLRGLCGVSDGTKKTSIEKTGYKGIGFKAVFGQSDKVVIYSNGDFFRFDSNYAFEWNTKWGDNQQNWEKDNDRLFYYPWQIIPIYTEREDVDERINAFINYGGFTVATIILLAKGKDDVKKAVEELSSNVNMFLFLKNIQELDFNIETPNVIMLNRKQDSTTVEIKHNGNTKFSWIIRSVKIQVPTEVRLKLKEEKNIPNKLLNATETELTFAAKIDQDTIQKLSSDERLLYSYLPTEERKYAFPVLVNSSFVMSANRETLHEDSKWNKWLFENIPAELLNWISELVHGRFGQSAYELIPIKSSISNLLTSSYQNSLSSALNSIPFILSNKNELIRVNQAIIDITSISKKAFITESATREFIIDKNNSQTIHTNPFLPYTEYVQILKNSGVAIFDWEDVPKLLESRAFQKRHSSKNNIQLIQFFKQQCEIENPKYINESRIKNWSFILDHKGNILPPSNIYFPTPDDENWNEPNSEISFLHADVQNFLLQNPETRNWLEKIGVTEKTDLSYLRKTIIANASVYSTLENTLGTISTIFSLYTKNEIGKDELEKLSELKLLTSKGSLLPARLCYFSDTYNPRLKLQTELHDDIFISESYLSDNAEKDEWKRFFKMMGVKDGITAISYPKTNKLELTQQYQFLNDYFAEEDKSFTPFLSTFQADEYSGLTTLLYLTKSNDINFLKIFWSDIIENISIEDFNTPAIAYWGNSGYPGRKEGDAVENYLKWYIQNNDCIPTLMNSCKKASEVYINTEDILSIAGSYLPIFFKDDLTQDWKAFFNFKTKLLLEDYLEILTKIASDTNKDGKIKKENVTRIQSIYKILLDQCTNWSQEDILKVEEWAVKGYLLSTKNIFVECHKLKFFIDGNESIFQDQFSFLLIYAENKQSSSLEFLLECLKIKILREGDFELIHSQEETCSNLIDKLKSIVPYFKTWIENQTNDPNTRDSLENLEYNINQLNVFQADELKIKYADVDFIKNVNVHFNNFNLFITNPWNSNSVLLKLPEILCRYFYLLGHDKKLDFLLRSSESEIQQHFAQENIDIPEKVSSTDITPNIENNHDDLHQVKGTVDKSIIPSDFYHLSKSDFDSLNYAKSIIDRAVKNVIKYLQTLSEYDCNEHYIIAESVIGGIKKNGNEITVVARPSDDDFILLYYTSEFDVLEYVDAELWCEDGLHAPKQVTLGQLLKKTGINKIPVKNIHVSHSELDALLTTPKNEELEFNAVPFVPQKIAQIISSFANTNGGSLIFGIKELNPNNNEMVGLSNDFRIDEITKKAISLLQPIPLIEYDWVQIVDKSIFMIKTTKSESDILLDNKKYIRKESKSFVEETSAESGITLHVPSFNKTIAIIIGIEDYFPKNNISPVKHANSDCQKFKDILINNLDVKEDEIYTFINEEALKNSIEYELKQLFHYLTETDRLIFYYVGHGFHNGITNYLSTYDMHKSNIPGTAVSLRTILLDPLQKSKCKNALIFIDACAQSFQDENERSQISNINDEELLLLSNDFPHYATFLSCQSGQSSYSSDNLKNGIWTYHLVEGISGNIPEVIKAKKYITDRLLSDYLSTSVAKYTMNELGKHQNPKTILDSSYENVILEIIAIEN